MRVTEQDSRDRWKGIEPNSPTNETQVINSLFLRQPIHRWVINPSLSASSDLLLRIEILTHTELSSPFHVKSLSVFVNEFRHLTASSSITHRGLFVGASILPLLSRLYPIKKVGFNRSNVHII